MNDKAMEYFLNPTKCRILIEIGQSNDITVTELSKKCPNIPRSTMYRHLAKMERDGMVRIISTERKRGTVEKTYAISDDLKEWPSEPSIEQMKAIYMQFMIKQLIDGYSYLNTEGLDVKESRLTFGVAPMYATDDEYMRAMMLIGNAIQELRENKPAPGRRLYSFVNMAIPSTEE